MKLKIKISYEWEEDLTEAWEDWKADGYNIEEFKKDTVRFHHAIERLDAAADNHIPTEYKRDLKIKWK